MSDARPLRNAFVANGLFSLLSGALFLIDAVPIADFAGIASPAVLRAIGAGLLPFGAWLVWLSRRSELAPRTGLVVSAMDLQWILGTVLLLTVWPELLNGSGQAVAVAIAAVVAVFAVWQGLAARRLAAAC